MMELLQDEESQEICSECGQDIENVIELEDGTLLPICKYCLQQCLELINGFTF